MPTNDAYAGIEWVRASYPDKVISPFGARVIALLGQLARGIYHIAEEVRTTDWSRPDFVEVVCDGTLNNLATFDSAFLTELVVLCHDARIRFSIRAISDPVRQEDVEEEGDRKSLEDVNTVHREYGLEELGMPVLQLQFHPRKSRDGSLFDQHPTIESAVARVRKSLLKPVAELVVPPEELDAWREKVPN